MFELISMILYGKVIWKMARQKSLNPWVYIAILIQLYIGFEVLGIVVGLEAFSDAGVVYIFGVICGLLGGYSAYFIAKNAKPR